jgi:colanic acid/amylovoran biosynthesis protein
MVIHLVRHHNAYVTFISTCQGVPGYPFDDSELAREIRASLPADVMGAVAVDDAFHSPEDLIETISSCDFVIATRMHMAILALCAGTPVIGIAYEFKTKELFRNMGMEDLVLDIESLSPSHACSLVDRLIGTLGGTRRKVIEAVSMQRESAMSVVPEIKRLIGHQDRQPTQLHEPESRSDTELAAGRA